MTAVTELRSTMLTSVTRTVKNRRMVTLLTPVEKGEDCINVVSGENIEYQDGLYQVRILNIKMDYF